VEVVAVPPCRIDLVPIAAIVIRANAAVCCPPAPLQCARLAAQVRRDDVAKAVWVAAARWQVEALWVPNINRLAIFSGIIRNAIRWGLCTHQRPRIGATVTHCSVADLHLKVTEMMCCDHMLKLGNLSTRISRTDGFFAVASRTKFRAVHQTVVVPRASYGLTQVAVTTRACEEQSHQSTGTTHGCHCVCNQVRIGMQVTKFFC